jgi:hypothetical protein
MPQSRCPICQHDTAAPHDEKTGGVTEIRCSICGHYFTSYDVIVDRRMNASVEDRAHVSGWIRDRWRRGETNIVVLSYDFDAILKDVRRMSPSEKADHLLVTLSRISKRPGVELSVREVSAADAWAVDQEELELYLIWLRDQGAITNFTSGQFHLTMGGWIETGRLQSTHKENATLAFMAMPFGDTRLAKAAGYDLRRLNEGQPAGLIDDQLRVRLRTARFVVADLTGGNQGAYWEAGFAEGLGTPVIYTCERSVFASLDHAKGTHFDTNHLVTVLWDPNNLAQAAHDLNTHIRATLPTEAKLED